MATFLTPDKTRNEYGLIIKEKIIPWGSVYPLQVTDYDGTVHKKGEKFKQDKLLSNNTGVVKGVTIHNTEDITPSTGTTRSEQYTRATWPNCAMNTVRVHYYVCQDEIWQNLKDNEVGWHATDNSNANGGNQTTIAIEIIGSSTAAEERGAKLAAVLLYKYNLSIDKLYTHNHWYSKKYCPCWILPHWDTFKKKVETYLNKIKTSSITTTSTSTSSTTDKKVLYRVRTDWTAASTQKGAYYSFDSAKALADTYSSLGYKVFDESGTVVYTPVVVTTGSKTTTESKTVKYKVIKKAPVKYTPTRDAATKAYLAIGNEIEVYNGSDVTASNGTVWCRFVYEKSSNKIAWIPKTYIQAVK